MVGNHCPQQICKKRNVRNLSISKNSQHNILLKNVRFYVYFTSLVPVWMKHNVYKSSRGEIHQPFILSENVQCKPPLRYIVTFVKLGESYNSLFISKLMGVLQNSIRQTRYFEHNRVNMTLRMTHLG